MMHRHAPQRRRQQVLFWCFSSFPIAAGAWTTTTTSRPPPTSLSRSRSRPHFQKAFATSKNPNEPSTTLSTRTRLDVTFGTNEDGTTSIGDDDIEIEYVTAADLGLDLDNGDLDNVDFGVVGVKCEALAAAGLKNNKGDDDDKDGGGESELATVLNAVEEALRYLTGVDDEDVADAILDASSLQALEAVTSSSAIVGATGRVLRLRTNLDGEGDENLRAAIAERLDVALYAEEPTLKQPVLLSFQSDSSHDEERSNNDDGGDVDMERILSDEIAKEIEQYEMRAPLPPFGPPLDGSVNVEAKSKAGAFVPSLHIEIDGDYIHDESRSDSGGRDDGSGVWDTSSVLVFDDLVDEDLRRRLLDVTLGRTSGDGDEWDDVANGPNPNRWERGGLSDIPTDDSTDDNDEDEESSSNPVGGWGLTDDAVEDLCFHHHDAIAEFETLLVKGLFPHFCVARLPEAVLGPCVSPLTANAPTAADGDDDDNNGNGDGEGVFRYHIDGDPNQTPPSPWTDVYGRYPNRALGKPRFVSVLLYLNDEWDGKAWGAPTRFYDPPTQSSYNVTPQPGRCVIMDQDVSHRVVAPNDAAGNRPRYSLVWKLVLHPRVEGQDMTDLEGVYCNTVEEGANSGSGGARAWPEPTLFGSAQRQQ